MIKDYLGRPLTVGDLVLMPIRNTIKRTTKNKIIIGLVVSSDGIYTGDDVLCHKCDECYLINNLDEKELALKKELSEKYNLLVVRKNELNNLKQIPGGIYKKSNGKCYLFIGKYKLSQNYAQYLIHKDKYIGYMYLELSEYELNELLLKKEANISELFYNQLSFIDGKTCVTSGYNTILPHVVLLRNNATICDSIGNINLSGFLNENKDINIVKYMENQMISYYYCRFLCDEIQSVEDMTFIYCGD